MTRSKIQWTSPTLWLAALASAALVVIAYAPHHIWPLGFIGFVPLAVSLRHSGANERFFFGWVAGTCTTLGGFYWIPALIVNFGELPLIVGIIAFVALALQQGLVAGVAFAATRWLEKGINISPIWSLPVAYVAAESAIPLIFPWRIGYTQYLNAPFIQSADLGGPFLVSGLVMLANSLIAALICERLDDNSAGVSEALKRSSRIRKLAAFAILVLNVGYGVIRIQQVDGREAAAETTRIGLVEADIPIEEKWDARLYERNIYRHQAASRALEDDGAELILWPESALEMSRYLYTTVPVDTLNEAREFAALERRVDYDATWFPASDGELPEREPTADGVFDADFSRFVPHRGFSTPLLTGATLTRALTDEESATLPPRGTFPRRSLSYNSSLLLSAEGRVDGVAHKVVRMPISEVIPYATGIYAATGINLYNIIPASGMFGAADGPQAVELPGENPLTIGILNCYEDLMPNFVRDMVREESSRPEVLINLTNDAWFGRTAEPIQHFALSTFRAVEARTWLIRATNTGISAFVDSAGRIISRTGIYDAETLIADVPHLQAEKTLFVRLGSWPAYITWLFVAFGLFRFTQKKRANRITTEEV